MKSFVLLTALLVSGCVQSHYTQTVSVRMDATGKVLERVETQTVQQGGQGFPITFKHIHDVQPEDPWK